MLRNRSGFRLGEDQSFGQPGIRKHRAEKWDRFAALHQQRRKIFHIDITDKVGLVFDIDPDETFVGMGVGQPVEIDPVGFADIAPGRAQACNDPSGFVGQGEQLLAVVMIKCKSGHGCILTPDNATGSHASTDRHVKIAV